MIDFDQDAVALYEAAMRRRALIGEAWEAEGCPVTTIGSRKQIVPHPYMRMLAEHDLLTDRLRQSVRKRHRGPVPESMLGPMVSPSERLRVARSGEEPPRVTRLRSRPPPG